MDTHVPTIQLKETSQAQLKAWYTHPQSQTLPLLLEVTTVLSGGHHFIILITFTANVIYQ